MCILHHILPLFERFRRFVPNVISIGLGCSRHSPTRLSRQALRKHVTQFRRDDRPTPIPLRSDFTFYAMAPAEMQWHHTKPLLFDLALLVGIAAYLLGINVYFRVWPYAAEPAPKGSSLGLPFQSSEVFLFLGNVLWPRGTATKKSC